MDQEKRKSFRIALTYDEHRSESKVGFQNRKIKMRIEIRTESRIIGSVLIKSVFACKLYNTELSRYTT